MTTIPVPRIAGCPAATGTLSGTRLGVFGLGMTRVQTHAADPNSSTHGTVSVDYFCLTPVGVRTGYPSRRLLATLTARRRARYAHTIIWISTSSAHYAIDTVRPGASLAYAAAHLTLSKPFQVGVNTWHLVAQPATTVVVKFRDRQVQEIGIALKALTTGSRSQQRVFLSSFN